MRGRASDDQTPARRTNTIHDPLLRHRACTARCPRRVRVADLHPAAAAGGFGGLHSRHARLCRAMARIKGAKR